MKVMTLTASTKEKGEALNFMVYVSLLVSLSVSVTVC